MLDVCPPLPLYIPSIWSDANEDNIVALLEHQNRVCRIDISISRLDTSNFSLISYPTTAMTVTHWLPGSASHTNSNSNSNSTSHLPPHALQSARDARLPRLADHRSPHDLRRRSALRRADAPQNDQVRARERAHAAVQRGAVLHVRERARPQAHRVHPRNWTPMCAENLLIQIGWVDIPGPVVVKRTAFHLLPERHLQNIPLGLPRGQLR